MANSMPMQFFFSLFYLSIIIEVINTLQVESLSKPEVCDRKAKSGDSISMRYKGNLFDVTTKELGKEFDSNFDRPQTFDFKLGAGQVIQGWEQGVPGMCVGEKRRLTVPPELAYGDHGFADLIPPKSTLVFEIELVDLKEGVAEETSKHGHDHGGHDHEPDSFAAIDANSDKQITSEEMTNYIKRFNDEGTEAEKFENIDTIVGEIFQEDDKNKDGVISLDEYQQFEEEEGGEGEADLEPPLVDESDPDGHLSEDEDEEYDEEGNEKEAIKEEL